MEQDSDPTASDLEAPGEQAQMEVVMDDGSELLRQAMRDLRPFVPHVHEHHELGLTEMLLRDCQTVWRPLDPGPHHVDLGYDPDGQLVGIRIWRCVMRADPERAP